MVSLFSQKIEQEGSVLLAILRKGLQSRRSSTYWKSLLWERWRVKNSLARVWPKKWGLSRNP
jgi:hypothetical protein